MKRSKGVWDWIQNDPLRKKYYQAGCPNGTFEEGHLLSFFLENPGSSKVKRVECLECGFNQSS